MGRIVYEVQGSTDEVQKLIKRGIVAAAKVPGFDMYVVAGRGVNKRSLQQIAKKEAGQSSRK